MVTLSGQTYLITTQHDSWRFAYAWQKIRAKKEIRKREYFVLSPKLLLLWASGRFIRQGKVSTQVTWRRFLHLSVCLVRKVTDQAYATEREELRTSVSESVTRLADCWLLLSVPVWTRSPNATSQRSPANRYNNMWYADVQITCMRSTDK